MGIDTFQKIIYLQYLAALTYLTDKYVFTTSKAVTDRTKNSVQVYLGPIGVTYRNVGDFQKATPEEVWWMTLAQSHKRTPQSTVYLSYKASGILRGKGFVQVL